MEKTMRLMCAAKAESMWSEFTESEKNMARFGMFPAAKMTAATSEGYDSRLLAVAIMDAASKDGGMRA